MKRIAASIVATVALAAAVLSAGCAGGVPNDPPGISGAVTTAQAGTGDVKLTMLVEGADQAPGAVADKAQVTVVNATRVLAADGSPISATEITVGQQVQVWFEGPVAESYPVQGAASVVLLVA